MQIPAARILQPPNREDVYPRLPFGQPSRRRSDSPPDGVADSPSGGPPKLGRSLGQPFGRTLKTQMVTWTALREALSNLRPKLRSLYGVAHIRCHLSGRASPSRTSSYRKLDSLPALRKLFSWEGERELAKHSMCMRT